MQTINDGTRSLIESIMMPEVITALRNWAKAKAPSVLIGALALSYYVKPRFTQDIDFLFAKDADVPDSVPGFTRSSDLSKARPAGKARTSSAENLWFGKSYPPSADARLGLAKGFCHRRTGVEVNVITASSSNVPKEIVEQVIRSTTASNGIRVASAAGLVALKLFRFSAQDRADIVALSETRRVDLSGLPLPPEKLAAFEALVSEAKTDPHPP
jgi:hypothetical protein